MNEFIKTEQSFLAKTLMGLESALVEELREIGARDIQPVKRGAVFSGDKSILYRANYELRTAIRVLVPIFDFKATNEKQLYEGIQEFPWDSVMSVKESFAINGTVFSDYFSHSHFVSLKTKDAIADQFRSKYNIRPNVNTEDPDLMINVHISGDHVTVSLDSSGESLHLRGYKKEARQAPMNEVLAAGLIKLSGWKPGDPFIDFMCGSGTLLSEAALMGENVAPGFFRQKFGFQKWKNYDEEMLDKIKGDAKEREVTYNGFIGGCDHSPGAVRAALQNLKESGIRNVEIEICDFKKYHHDLDHGVLIVNPPYGERLAVEDITGLYKEIGDTWKQQYKGFKTWMITSSPEGVKSIGLKPFKKYDVMNGSLECKFLGFDIYAGSKKAKYQQQHEA